MVSYSKKSGGNVFAKPSVFAVSWTHSPVARNSGFALRQSRHGRLILSHETTQTLPMFCKYVTAAVFLFKKVLIK